MSLRRKKRQIASSESDGDDAGTGQAQDTGAKRPATGPPEGSVEAPLKKVKRVPNVVGQALAGQSSSSESDDDVELSEAAWTEVQGCFLIKDLVRVSADSGAPLAQALRKLGTSSIFNDLRRSVSENSPQPGEWLALIDADARQEAEDCVIPLGAHGKMKAAVQGGSNILMIDCTGMDAVSTNYNAFLHTINVAGVLKGNPEYLAPPADYFVYFRRALFELCNATAGSKLRNIYQQATAGDLDCLNFVLSIEIVECASEDMFIGLWQKVMADEECCTVLTADGPKRLKAPRSGYSGAGLTGDLQNRIKDQWKAKHIEYYINIWVANYRAAYIKKNKVSFDALMAWAANGRAKPNFNLSGVVMNLTGQALTGSFTFYEDYFKQAGIRKKLQAGL
ncbi:hypothetical protein Acor_59300 [Acrocarpospora corrugata]|uniref:Uncharacterized protein n=1 Tax=Acrocarpospora corrugata TaxID=35763 RepID=A0A5M3W511_9ACTN|nr:hypothetical protein [Acrocarpospora corrugata]GES03864.1 hypothetical protein Acor_59300 [Acrocarpospora corrugata]